MESFRECSRIGLRDLPEDCISSILSFTTPSDVARLALVSHNWRSAADSNTVWEKMLPDDYREILSRAITAVADFPSMKQLYLHLCQSILIDNGSKRVWVDRSTGKVGCMLSARDLTISWGDNNRHWNWVSRDDSRFEEVAELKYVWGFEVKGRLDCTVLSPSTRYRVSFVVKMDENRMSVSFYGNYRSPLSFSVDSVHADQMGSARYLNKIERAVESTSRPIRGAKGWMELVAGEFFLEADDGLPREIGFCMKTTDCNIIKRCILIEGVRIEAVC